MAQKTGKFKKLFLSLVLIALAAIIFILLGGGDLLRSAGKKVEHVGQKADQIKQQVEEKAATVEKKVEKGIEAIKPGEKK